jgi:DNA-binding transcriptional regulator GbsR (MarR family)
VHAAASDFIEHMGLVAEADGLSRIAGRLFGALLLADAPRSLDDLAERLGVSKASVSTDIRRLRDRGVAERVGRPGDRRDYYQLAPDFFTRIIRFRVARWARLHQLVRDLRRATPAGTLPRGVRERFDSVDAVHTAIVARIDAALRDFDGRRAATPSRRRRSAAS